LDRLGQVAATLAERGAELVGDLVEVAAIRPLARSWQLDPADQPAVAGGVAGPAHPEHAAPRRDVAGQVRLVTHRAISRCALTGADQSGARSAPRRVPRPPAPGCRRPVATRASRAGSCRAA